MMYDNREHVWCDGEWHCPFSPEWVDKMARAAKHCDTLTEEQIDNFFRILNNGKCYVRPRLEFLNEEQDARGLPLSLSKNDEYYLGCCATYDYSSIPDVMITNGYDDWPLKLWESTINI